MNLNNVFCVHQQNNVYAFIIYFNASRSSYRRKSIIKNF